MNPRLRDECLCGECGPCRRSLKAAAYIPPTPVTLGEKARAILAEPAGTPYRPPPSHRGPGGYVTRAVIERNAHGNVKHDNRHRAATRPSRAKTERPKPTTTACNDCGQLRGLKPAGHANKKWALAGKGNLCEVCADKPWIAEVLAATPPSPLTSGFKHQLQKARRYQHRILKDGRAYHPDAQHGTSTAYTNYGCKCVECVAWKTEYNRNYERRTA